MEETNRIEQVEQIGQTEQVKRIGRTPAYKGSVMQVYVDEMLMPDGKKAYWDFFSHNGGAAVVAVTEDEKILMVRQFRNAIDMDSLEIPAGALDYPEENPDNAAARELEEETGYRCSQLEKLVTDHSLPAFTNEKVSIYLATGLRKTAQHLDEQEFLNVESYTLEELLAMIREEKITDGKTLVGIMAYALLKK